MKIYYDIYRLNNEQIPYNHKNWEDAKNLFNFTDYKLEKHCESIAFKSDIYSIIRNIRLLEKPGVSSIIKYSDKYYYLNILDFTDITEIIK